MTRPGIAAIAIPDPTSTLGKSGRPILYDHGLDRAIPGAVAAR